MNVYDFIIHYWFGMVMVALDSPRTRPRTVHGQSIGRSKNLRDIIIRRNCPENFSGGNPENRETGLVHGQSTDNP